MFELYVSRRYCQSLNHSEETSGPLKSCLSSPPAPYNRVAERLAEGANGSQFSSRASSPGNDESTVLPLSDVRTLLPDNLACATSWTHRPTVGGFKPTSHVRANPRRYAVIRNRKILLGLLIYRRQPSKLVAMRGGWRYCLSVFTACGSQLWGDRHIKTGQKRISKTIGRW